MSTSTENEQEASSSASCSSSTHAKTSSAASSSQEGETESKTAPPTSSASSSSIAPPSTSSTHAKTSIVSATSSLPKASSSSNAAEDDKSGLRSSDPVHTKGLSITSGSRATIPSSSATSSTKASKPSSSTSSVPLQSSTGDGKAPTTTTKTGSNSKASAATKAEDHGLLLRRWFRSLTVQERRRVVSIMDEELGELVLIMSLKVKKEGPGLFSEVGQTDDDTLFGLPTEVARNRSNSLSHLPPYSKSSSNTNSRQGRSLFRGNASGRDSRRASTSVGRTTQSRSKSQTREPILRFRQGIHAAASSSSSSNRLRISLDTTTPPRASPSTTKSSSASASPRKSNSDVLQWLGNAYGNESSKSKKKGGGTSASGSSSSSFSNLAASSSSASSSKSTGVELSTSATDVRGSTRKSPFPVRYFDDFFASDLIALNPYTPDEENFIFRRHCSIINGDSFTSRTIQMDQELVDAVRLCDAKQYLDTITLSSELMKSPKRFFDVMRTASRGEFLKKPCKMNWQAMSGSWNVEHPQWFKDMGVYTFSTFLACQFEMRLWQAYYHYANIDPRRESGHFGSGSSKASAKVISPQNRHQDTLISKSHLVEFWTKLSRPQKTDLIRSMGNMIEAKVKLDMSELSYPQLLNFLVKLTSVSHNVSNADNPLLQPNNEREFIDFIFFSPLRRAGTGVDLVLRRLGVFLETAYVDQQRADLILGEKMEKEKAQSKRSNKRKTRSNTHSTGTPLASSSSSIPSQSKSSTYGASTQSVTTQGSTSHSSQTSAALSAEVSSISSTTSSAASHPILSRSSTDSTTHTDHVMSKAERRRSTEIPPSTSTSASNSHQTSSTTSNSSNTQPIASTVISTLSQASGILNHASTATPASSTPSTSSQQPQAESLMTMQALSAAGFTVAGRRKGPFTRAKDDSAAPNQKKPQPIDHGKAHRRSKDDTHNGIWTGPSKRTPAVNATSTSSTAANVASVIVTGSRPAPSSPKAIKRDVSSTRPFANGTSSVAPQGQSAVGAASVVSSASTTPAVAPSNSSAMGVGKVSLKTNIVPDYMDVPLSPSSSSSSNTNTSTASTSTPHTYKAASSSSATGTLASIPSTTALPTSHSSPTSTTTTPSSSLKTSSESLPAPMPVEALAQRLEPLRSRPTSSPPAPLRNISTSNPTVGNKLDSVPDVETDRGLRSSASSSSSSSSTSSSFASYTTGSSTVSGNSFHLVETMSDRGDSRHHGRHTGSDRIGDRPHPTQKTKTMPSLYRSSPATISSVSVPTPTERSPTKAMNIAAQPYYPPLPATLSPPRSAQLYSGQMRQSTPPGRLQGMDSWITPIPQWGPVPIEFGPGNGASSTLGATSTTPHAHQLAWMGARSKSADEHVSPQYFSPSGPNSTDRPSSSSSSSSSNWKGHPKSPQHNNKRSGPTILAMPMDPSNPLAYAMGGGPTSPMSTTQGAPMSHAFMMAVPHEQVRVEFPTRPLPELDRLTEDITDFVARVDVATVPREKLVYETVKRVQKVVDTCFPGSGLKAEVYGSFASNLGIPASDLDLVITLPRQRLTQSSASNVVVLASSPNAHSEPTSANAGETDSNIVGITQNSLTPQASSVDASSTQSPRSSSTTDSTSESVAPKASASPVGPIPISNIVTSAPSTQIQPPLSPRELALIPLTTLFACLTQEPWVRPEKTQLISTASVPVIKLVCIDAEFPVDITMEDRLRPHTGLSTRTLTAQFCQRYPQLRPLALVLKQMLHDCNLHNIYTGGISSYFLVLLIVSYLQVYGHTSKNLGGHLLNLLDLYGNKFNFAATQISVIEPGSHLIIPPQQNFSHHHTDLSPPHTPSVPPLNVVDPLNPSQIVGQSVFGMWQVQLAFRNAYAVLHMHYLEEGIPEHPTAIDQLLASILSSPM